MAHRVFHQAELHLATGVLASNSNHNAAWVKEGMKITREATAKTWKRCPLEHQSGDKHQEEQAVLGEPSS